jgi:hypothetical protein
LAELGNGLMKEWNILPIENIWMLIDSMARRCEAVYDANGGHTRY